MGLGGELPVASTLVSESVEAKERGRVVVLLESFWAAGWLIAAIISYFVIPAEFWPIEGWRVALILTAIPALYAVYIRMHLPDSPQFTARSRSEKSYNTTKYCRGLGKEVCTFYTDALDSLVHSSLFLLWNVLMATKCYGWKRV